MRTDSDKFLFDRFTARRSRPCITQLFQACREVRDKEYSAQFLLDFVKWAYGVISINFRFKSRVRVFIQPSVIPGGGRSIGLGTTSTDCELESFGKVIPGTARLVSVDTEPQS